MTPEEKYDFIGELAIALYSKKIQMSLTALNAMLADRSSQYDSNRGLASGVAAAYRHWKEKDPVVHHAIAFTFTNKHGQLAWD